MTMRGSIPIPIRRKKGGEDRTRTHHLTELDGRLANLISNPNRNLRRRKEKKKKQARQLHISSSTRKKEEKRHHTQTTPSHAARSEEYHLRGR